VTVDKAGNLYVNHEGRADLPDHPNILVFDPDGRYVRSFGQQFQGGGHGLEVHEENGEEFLYVTGFMHLKNFAKLTLQGEQIWQRHAPMETGLYAEGENTHPENIWGRNRFMPTNTAFHPTSGDFWVADGYGSYAIHRYDHDAKYKSSFGGDGNDDGMFNLPHGIWLDRRPGREPTLVVADRVNSRLQWFDLDGKHLKTLDGFLYPASIDTYGETMLVPDLSSRITLLDGQDKVIVHLGDDADWRENVMKSDLRTKPDTWMPGKFLHPHDACFDADGNIFVAEWVATGRVTKLRRVN
jgi:hypothetical protein